MVNRIVTVSRQFGSGGGDIDSKLGNDYYNDIEYLLNYLEYGERGI